MIRIRRTEDVLRPLVLIAKANGYDEEQISFAYGFSKLMYEKRLMNRKSCFWTAIFFHTCDDIEFKKNFCRMVGITRPTLNKNLRRLNDDLMVYSNG